MHAISSEVAADNRARVGWHETGVCEHYAPDAGRYRGGVYTVSLVQPGVGYGDGYTPDEYDDDFFARFTRQEEPMDRKLVFRCTKSELDAIKRYANIIDIKFTEEEIHHA